MSPALLTLLLLLTLLSTVRSQAQADAEQQKAQQDVQARMKDLVDSVQEAVGEAKEANQKREVVDLGQSLHMLETKFGGLRAALATQVSAKSKRLNSYTGTIKEITERSTDIVSHIANQRTELAQLGSDLIHVDTTIHELLINLEKFDSDVTKLSKVVKDLHVNHHELTNSHRTTQSIFRQVTSTDTKKTSKSHTILSVVIVVEIALMVAFLYLKRNASAVTHKAYGKFG